MINRLGLDKDYSLLDLLDLAGKHGIFDGQPTPENAEILDLLTRLAHRKAREDLASKGELADWQRPPVPELQQIVDVLGSVMHEMLAGKRTPEDAVKESQQEIDRIMRKAGYY